MTPGAGHAPGAALLVSARSDVGRERTLNEDTFRVAGREDDWILVVCDGMGGHEGGEVASEVAANWLLDALRGADTTNPTVAIYEALVGANTAVVAEAARRGMPSMGSTAVVARVLGDRCWIGWVGDSRLYQLRAGVRISGSEDHTRVAEMVRRGILTPAEAKVHPEAHILTQALGGGAAVGEGAKPSAWNEPLELLPGDVLLLCSDGLYDLLTDHEIADLMAGLAPDAAAERLVDAANARGGHDNVTVVVALYGAERIAARAAAPWTDAAAGAEASHWTEHTWSEPTWSEPDGAAPAAPAAAAAPASPYAAPPALAAPASPYATPPHAAAPPPAPGQAPPFGRAHDEQTLSDFAPGRGGATRGAPSGGPRTGTSPYPPARTVGLPLVVVLVGLSFVAGALTMLLATQVIGAARRAVPAQADVAGAPAAGLPAVGEPPPAGGAPPAAEAAPTPDATPDGTPDAAPDGTAASPAPEAPPPAPTP